MRRKKQGQPRAEQTWRGKEEGGGKTHLFWSLPPRPLPQLWVCPGFGPGLRWRVGMCFGVFRLLSFPFPPGPSSSSSSCCCRRRHHHYHHHHHRHHHHPRLPLISPPPFLLFLFFLFFLLPLTLEERGRQGKNGRRQERGRSGVEKGRRERGREPEAGEGEKENKKNVEQRGEEEEDE